jgi:glucosamine-6-phosphate deaminase
MAMQNFTVGKLRIELYPDRLAAAQAAAQAALQAMILAAREVTDIGVVFATGASQLEMLAKLTRLPDIPWQKISGFHLDEYVDLPRNHRASFRRYLEENLVRHVPLKSFHEIDGSAPDPERVCREYTELLRACPPALCLLGIGENGHLAFNEPGEADFHDPLEVRIVELDAVCRRQQVAEGWFDDLHEVPQRAITLTIPTILKIPRLIVSVSGSRKATIVWRTLSEPTSPACPATILRHHPNATIYLDKEAAAELRSTIPIGSQEYGGSANNE